MINVIARVKAAAGSENRLQDVLTACVEPTRQETGCHLYVLHQGVDDPTLFMFYETWTDKAALDAHMQTPHFKRLATDSAALVDGEVDISVLHAFLFICPEPCCPRYVVGEKPLSL